MSNRFSLDGNDSLGIAPAQRDAAQGRTVERALTLLEAFADEPRLSLVVLARRAGLSPSTASRLLAVLEAHRFVERDPATKRYLLGLRTFELAGAVGARLGLRGLARPELERLAAATKDTVHLAIADGDEAVYIEKLEGDQYLQLRTYVGGRTPLHSTAVGKALLAFWPPHELARFVSRGLPRYTSATVADPAALDRELLAVRQRGYATNLGEYQPVTGGLAAPVFDAREQVIAAVGVAGALDRFAPERIPILADAVIAAARDLSIRLGWPTKRLASSGG